MPNSFASTGLDFVGFSVSDRRARLMDCSQRTIQGSKVYFTNSRDCCSILEKMRHQSLSEDKGRHFRIWLIVKYTLEPWIVRWEQSITVPFYLKQRSLRNQDRYESYQAIPSHGCRNLDGCTYGHQYGLAVLQWTPKES